MNAQNQNEFIAVFMAGHVKKHRTMHEIAAAAQEATGFTLADLRSPCREHPLVHVRQEAMALAAAQGFSLPQVGRFFCRDHTTVLNAIRSVERRRKEREANAQG